MPSTSFIDQETIIPTDWANGVDAVIFEILNNPQSVSEARSALGLVIGQDVQTQHLLLDAISNISVADGNIIVGNGVTFTTIDTEKFVIDPDTGHVSIGSSAVGYKLTINDSDTSIVPQVSIAQASSGDAALTFILSLVGDQQQWTVGIDNSDGNSFKITRNASLGVLAVIVTGKPVEQ